MKTTDYHRAVLGRRAFNKTASVARGVLFIFVFVSALSAAGAASGAERSGLAPEDERVIANPHDPVGGRSQCSACHTAKPPELSFDAVTTCVKCHSGNVDSHPVSRHPVGEVVRIRVPSFLPLTGDGRMVCYTCHDPHDKGRRKKMLRVDFQSLCSSCHVGY
ncbi:MAG: hypothetical protein HZB85_10285 [Deltaproteobacteria bacterium]|nr:hypothetical protein [Deltaproteobacteria bacterium]